MQTHCDKCAGDELAWIDHGNHRVPQTGQESCLWPPLGSFTDRLPMGWRVEWVGSGEWQAVGPCSGAPSLLHTLTALRCCEPFTRPNPLSPFSNQRTAATRSNRAFRRRNHTPRWTGMICVDAIHLRAIACS